MKLKHSCYTNHLIRQGLLTAALTCSSLTVSAATIIGTDLNSAISSSDAIRDVYSANQGSNGGGDQSLQFGDVLEGSAENDTIIGGLGIDILSGASGDDVLIGGTEDFNALNRDRAFGQEGDDTFVWAPGDGNDFFDGGSGDDVLIMGLIGETQDADGNTEGAPFFAVSPPGKAGSGDFDGIYLNSDSNPVIDVAGGPGFCELVEADDSNGDALAELDLDHLVRFVLRGPRQAFDDATAADPLVDPATLDTGLRVAIHLKGVEYLVCAGAISGSIEVIDLRSVPAQQVDVSQLPARAYELVSGR